ncbi:hypothetical protein EO95_06020 [Methanosarcina sp. 1.H.T.1A.1]|uniref:hypothetical protein n=1 Tax=Methanosarcina sp. 1.H.T.1A.1 TaxID=1483602 RepID=UPI00062293FE|nr:hypothetical protein [Methanosarcina sp. 1.H.T.1A.1]KKH99423.1 hypothetical protein EO95_06020 [Methanosarcina sp. 1.H.T.1A.1]
MDIGTGLAIIGGRELIVKILGPTADYIGNETKNLVEKSHENIKQIFINAEKFLGPKIDSPGKVSPRVLKHIINEGAFCDEELTREYFGGVLASSRNNDLRDDRGLTFISLIESMSSYQIRTHYIFYTIVKELFDGKNLKLGKGTERKKMQVFLPFDLYVHSMDVPREYLLEILLPHILWGLSRLDLISNFASGSGDSVKKHYQEANTPGIIFTPTVFGIEFYMWAHGYSDTPRNKFLDKNTQFIKSKILDIPKGAVSTEIETYKQHSKQISPKSRYPIRKSQRK